MAEEQVQKVTGCFISLVQASNQRLHKSQVSNWWLHKSRIDYCTRVKLTFTLFESTAIFIILKKLLRFLDVVSVSAVEISKLCKLPKKIN